MVIEDGKYKLALIGCGDISSRYIEAANLSKYVKIVKLMDTNEQNAKSQGDTYGIPWTTSYEEVLEDESIYGVIISTPHYLHYPLTEKAAMAGKHILCDKPISTNVEDGSKMIDICHKCGVTLSINYAARYNNRIQKVKKMVEAGYIGDVFLVQIQFLVRKKDSYWTSGHNSRVVADWRRSLEKSGGGVLIMNITHNLDFIRYITGIGVNSILGYTGRYGESSLEIEVEDTAAAVMKLDNGGIMSVTASSAVNATQANLNIIAGNNGTIEFNPYDGIRFFLKKDCDGYESGKWHEIHFKEKSLDYHGYLDEWAIMQKNGSGVPISGEDALYILKIVKDIYNFEKVL